MRSTYSSISAMEPLLPDTGKTQLAELATQIYIKAGELKASIPSPDVRQEVAGLLAEMNSYYSNLIEGHQTLPSDIQKALKEDFSPEVSVRKNQNLSVAHIKTDRKMRQALAKDPSIDVYSTEFICWLHHEFYSCLPREFRTSAYGSGKTYEILPGELRSYNVDVGKHTPPDHASLQKFLSRFQEVYSTNKLYSTNQLIALSAAHHRLAWIHPFGDGNGRVARLQSHAALIRAGVDGEGLWTLSRGLARERDQYYEKLAFADIQKQGQRDGRGNLSEAALSEFCRFFLDRILDQMNFMSELLRPLEVAERIDYYFRYDRRDLRPREQEQLSKVLKVLWLEGPIPRGRVREITNLGETAARAVIRKALSDELISSETEKGNIRIVFPSKVLEFYFPRLFIKNIPLS